MQTKHGSGFWYISALSSLLAACSDGAQPTNRVADSERDLFGFCTLQSEETISLDEISPLGFARVIELKVGGDVDVRGVQIHTSPMSHGDDPLARGHCYLVRGSGPSVFLCGDGAWFSGFAEIGARHAPDIAVLRSC